MILSVGLTPAWQQILVFDAFQYGEVNRAQQVLWCASGKVTNVGIAVHQLGGPSLTLATVGGPPLKQFEKEFTEMDVPHRWVKTQSATRICTTILDRSTGTTTELVENGGPLSPEELEEFRVAFADEATRASVIVVTGSLPEGTPELFYRDLVEQARCPVVLDIRGAGLLSVLDLEPLVVKPNRDELSQTVGRPLKSDEELISAMRSINERGARWVVVTQGAGCVWVTSETTVHRLQAPPVAQVVNPIASGDAMAAAIAWAVRDGRDMIDGVRLGIAAATQNVQQILPCRLDHVAVETAALEVAVEPD